MEDRAGTYDSIQNRIFFYEVLLSLAFLTLFIVSGASWRLSAYIQSYCPNIWLKIYVYVVYFALIYSVITFPLLLYGGYIVERRFGLSTQTFCRWLLDYLKAFFIYLILSLVGVELVYLLLRERPGDWWLWGAVIWILGGVILARVAPRVIIPLFFKLERVEDEDLVERLRVLAGKAGAAVRDIYSVDMSSKSRKANAAVAGLGRSKKIILSDTLISGYSPEEIEAVIAHELGHYAGGHVRKRIIFSAVLILCAFYIAGRIMTPIAVAAGIDSIADVATLPVFALILFIFGLIVLPLENAYSRRLEAKADAFSLESAGNPAAFISAMEKLAEQNLVRKEPNKVIAFLLHGHPSISNRIKMAKEYMNSGSGESCTDLSQSI